MNSSVDDTVCVGHIIGPQGVQGWLKVFSDTSPRENLLDYSPLLMFSNNRLQAVEIEQGRLQGKQVLMKLKGVDDRDQAVDLSGQKIYMNTDQLPILDEGDYYWADLIGLSVETIQADELGVIDTMLETGANDVMVLKGERERLIPFVMQDIVKKVDLANKKVLVDWHPDD